MTWMTKATSSKNKKTNPLLRVAESLSTWDQVLVQTDKMNLGQTHLKVDLISQGA